MKKFYATLTTDIYNLAIEETSAENQASNIVEKFILQVDTNYEVNYITIEYTISSIYTDEEDDSYRTLELSFLLSSTQTSKEIESQLYELLQAVDTGFNGSVQLTDFNDIKNQG